MEKAKESRISLDDENYPSLLREIIDPPAELYIRGHLPALAPNVVTISIVGTRKATATGMTLARRLAEDFSRRGVLIVSGLAWGIDAAAHEGALRGGAPTIAVLAGGISSYPRRNESLAKKIVAEGGALLSEEPEGISIQKYHFLRRNRIVAGLSHAVVIIEAPDKSGSLVTGRLAAESGREVFVFPGPISHPNYKGSHALIRDGARLVTSAEDILEDLGIDARPSPGEISGEKNSDQALIIKVLVEAGEPLSIDKIVQFTKLEPHIVATNVTLLVINQHIKETEKGYTI